MNVYDSILRALGDKNRTVFYHGHLDRESAMQRLSCAPHDTSGEPHLMFAFNEIGYDNETGAWRQRLKIELFSIADVLGMKEIPALLELETLLIADLFTKELGEDYRTPSSWDIADMLLYYPRYALPGIRELGHQRRSFLQRILEISTPARDPEVTENDFFCAYSLGNYIPDQIEGMIRHYLSGSIRQGMEVPDEDESDAVPAFFEELARSREDEDHGRKPEGLTPSETMMSIASFYNAFMRYRDLWFVKKRLERIAYDVEHYSSLARFCKDQAAEAVKEG